MTDVSIPATLEAGSTGLTLTCTVSEAIPGLTNMPSALWMKDSLVVEGSAQSISLTEIFRNDTTALTTLSFSPLKTSRAGRYTCQGMLDSVAATNGIIATSAEPVTVNVICEYSHCIVNCCLCVFYNTVPTPNVTLSIPSGPLYEGTSQTLNCSATLPSSVDTDVTVTIEWTPRETFPTIELASPPFYSLHNFNPLTISDTGQYTCRAKADSSSPYITESSHGLSQSRTLIITGIIALYYLCDYLCFFHLFRSTSSKCQHLILWRLHCWPAIHNKLLSNCCD